MPAETHQIPFAEPGGCKVRDRVDHVCDSAGCLVQVRSDAARSVEAIGHLIPTSQIGRPGTLPAMHCQMCRSEETKVIDSRAAEEGMSIRRRRECIRCGHRFTTFERAAYRQMVQKRDGRMEPFSAGKVRFGIEQALADRPVRAGLVETLVTDAGNLFSPTNSIVSAAEIGDAVLEGLRAADEVAYLRFASVYKDFTGAGDFEREMASLEERNR